MSNFDPNILLAYIKLFNFLDSDTIASKNWVNSYLKKVREFQEEDLFNAPNVSLFVAHLFASHEPPSDRIKQIAKRMGDAWRTRKSREKNKLVSVTVTLQDSVSNQLSKMCVGGRKKSDVVTMLIEDNFKAFLVEENLRKKQLADRKLATQLLSQQASLQRINQLEIRTVPTANRQDEADELKSTIAQLYDTLFSENSQFKKIDDETMIQDTKIYYTVIAIAKTPNKPT